MAIIPTLTLSRSGELSRSWIPKNNKCPNSQRKKNSSWLVYVLHKMIIRHFHVVVVWWRQQNVQISVMHVQICCCSFDVLVAAVVDRILRSLFLLPLPLLIPVTRCYFHYQYQYQYHYPPPATRYSLPLTLPLNHYHLRRFWVKPASVQMLLLGAHMIDYHGKDPL